MLDRAVVRNATNGPIKDVLVRHEPTGAIGRASAILPASELDLGFSRQPMKAKRAVVTWQSPAGQSNRAEIALPHNPPRGGDEPEPTYTLVYTIQLDGTVSIHLEP